MELIVERFDRLSYRRIIRFDFLQALRVTQRLGGIASLLQEARGSAERVVIIRVRRDAGFEHRDGCGGLSGVV